MPNANEMTPSWAMVNGASPLTISVAGTEPTPMNTRVAVPSVSASRTWEKLFSAMWCARDCAGDSPPRPETEPTTRLLNSDRYY
jgi:hypothetical protein